MNTSVDKRRRGGGGDEGGRWQRRRGRRRDVGGIGDGQRTLGGAIAGDGARFRWRDGGGETFVEYRHRFFVFRVPRDQLGQLLKGEKAKSRNWV